jgi:DNA modification methylase
MNTDRRFIGIERDPEYFRIAEERIQQSFITNYCNDL